MRILANECGLEVVRSFRDGYGLQFWGSELYQRGIPLRQGPTLAPDRARELLGEASLSEYDRRAKELNVAGTETAPPSCCDAGPSYSDAWQGD